MVLIPVARRTGRARSVGVIDGPRRPQFLIAQLLRFESSRTPEGELTSLADYIRRMHPLQKRIYFLNAPSREKALASPYFEVFERKGIEVLILTMGVDEYVMEQYDMYEGRPVSSAEDPGLALDHLPDVADAAGPGDPMTPGQCARYGEFLMSVLADKLIDAKPTQRLLRTPAIVVSSFQQATGDRHRLKFSALQGVPRGQPLGMQVLEFNPCHGVNKRLLKLSRSTDTDHQRRAREVALQLFDHCLIAAGLLEDPRSMLHRLHRLMESSLQDVPPDQVDPTGAGAAADPDPRPRMASKADLLAALGGGSRPARNRTPAPPRPPRPPRPQQSQRVTTGVLPPVRGSTRINERKLKIFP